MEYLSNKNKEKRHASQHAESYPLSPEALSEYNAKCDPEYLLEQASQSYESGKTNEAARTLGYIGWTLEGLEAVKSAEEAEQE